MLLPLTCLALGLLPGGALPSDGLWIFEDVIDVLTRLDLPDVTGKPWVCFSSEGCPVEGFRLSQEPGFVEVLSLRPGVTRWPVDPPGIREVDFAKVCADFLAEPAGNNSFFLDLQGDYEMRVHAVNGSVLAFVAMRRGDRATAEDLFLFAEQSLAREFASAPEHAPLLADFVAAAISVDRGSDAMVAAKRGEPRRDLLARWRKIGRLTEWGEKMAGRYESLLAEDEVWTGRSPADLAALPPRDRAAHWVHCLRDVAEGQGMQPGRLSVFGVFGYFELAKRDTPHPAYELVALGREAVPVLLAHLADERPTRCLGYWRDFAPASYHLETIGEACLEILRVITKLDLSEEDAAERVREWLAGQGPVKR